jgi:hypothetical protein
MAKVEAKPTKGLEGQRCSWLAPAAFKAKSVAESKINGPENAFCCLEEGTAKIHGEGHGYREK